MDIDKLSTLMSNIQKDIEDFGSVTEETKNNYYKELEENKKDIDKGVFSCVLTTSFDAHFVGIARNKVEELGLAEAREAAEREATKFLDRIVRLISN